MKRISLHEWLEFEKAYNRGEHPHQRLGQAFVNNYYPASGESTAKLFYAEGYKEAYQIVFKDHIDWSLQ